MTSHICRFEAEAEFFMPCSNGGTNEWVHCVSPAPSISLLSHVYITCVGKLLPIINTITQTTSLVFYHKIICMAIACIMMAKLQRAAAQTGQWEHSCYRYLVLQCWQSFPCPKCLLHKAQWEVVLCWMRECMKEGMVTRGPSEGYVFYHFKFKSYLRV